MSENESHCKLKLGNIKATKIITHPTRDIHAIISKRKVTLITTIPSLQVKINIFDLDNDEIYRCADFAGTDDILILLGGYCGILKIFDITKRKFVCFLKGHGNSINSLKTHSKDRNIVFTGSSDNTIRMWDIKNKRTLQIFGGIAGHRDLILSIDISLCGSYLVSSSNDYTIKVWSVPDKCSLCDQYMFKHHDCSKSSIFSNPFPIFTSSKIHQSFITCVRFLGTFIVAKGSGNNLMLFMPDFTKKVLESYTVSKSHFIENVDIKAEKLTTKFFVDQKRSLVIVGDCEKEGVFYVKKFNGENNIVNTCATNVKESIRFITYKNGYLYILYNDSMFHKIKFDRF